MLTFDELGVSGHPNHIGTHYGVRRWYKNTQHSCRLCFLVCYTCSAQLQSSHPAYRLLVHLLYANLVVLAITFLLYLQKTVPLVVKFLGPLLQLLVPVLRLIAGPAQLLHALPTGRKPGVVIATAQHISEIQVAMQAHASQYVWYAVPELSPVCLRVCCIMSTEHAIIASAVSQAVMIQSLMAYRACRCSNVTLM